MVGFNTTQQQQRDKRQGQPKSVFKNANQKIMTTELLHHPKKQTEILPTKRTHHNGSTWQQNIQRSAKQHFKTLHMEFGISTPILHHKKFAMKNTNFYTA